MTTPELITDDIIEKAMLAMGKQAEFIHHNSLKAAILAIQDDITRPVYNILQGYKRDAQAYEKALNIARNEMDRECRRRPFSRFDEELYSILDKAIKGYYHETDFTKFCKENEK